MARARGIYKKFEERLKLNPTQIRSAAMKTITTAAKELIREVLGEEGVRKPGLAWFVAIKMVAPTFWELAKSKETIPSYEEVVAAVKSKYADYADRLRSAYRITKVTV